MMKMKNSSGARPGAGVGAVEVRSLTKVFGEEDSPNRCVALAGVDMEIGAGEFVTIVGPSGCGKSTLLEIVAGLQAPTLGEVVIDGQTVKGPGTDRAIVFQQYALFPWLTARDNVAFALRAIGMATGVRLGRADALLDMVGLGAFKRHYPHQLSGGMRQRVAIARALSTSPSILLMDEPFGALDALTRQVMQTELLRVLVNNQATVLFVTHSLDEALYLSDRIVLFTSRPGRVRTEVRLPKRDRSTAVNVEIASDPELVRVRRELRELLYEEYTAAEVGEKGAC